ncbi:MAG: DUF423 domain-containing protein [Candidatus Sericytochromatia bacterium]|nr:DUF423 domain-containing protein [Candidatus Tanganyikabacteria bacterium]
MDRVFFAAGCLSGLLAVAAGAFGAHGLRARLDPALLEVWKTAANYQLIHALALVAVAWAAQRFPQGTWQPAGWCFLAGTLLFCGSLYGLSALGWRFLGPITPLGGLAFLAGWALLAWAAIK